MRALAQQSSEAAVEISSSIAQSGDNVQLDKVTQENAAMFEETSAASQIREAAANTMTGLVEQFTRQSSASSLSGTFISDSSPATAEPLKKAF